MGLSKKLLTGAIVSSLGGLLFGFDTAVISGAEQGLKVFFDLDAIAHGFTNSIALIGTIIGAIFAFIPAQYWGRKKSLLIIGAFFGLSALGCAFTSNWEFFLFYRFLGGLGVGASSVIAPMYISEISPSTHRGRLVGLFQFSIVFGILLAFISNYFLKTHISVNAWRWMLGVEAIPALLFFILTFFIPKSPRWLILKGKDEKGLQILTDLGDLKAKVTFNSIKRSLNQNETKESLFQKKYYKPILLVFLMATFNQFSGINAIMYYAPRIFEMSGLTEDSAFLQAASVGFVNMIFTIFAMSLIDKIGRKKLMLWGSVGMIISLVFSTFFLNQPEIGKGLLIIPILTFIASFAFSQGAVIWVFISEIFPNRVRASGQSFGTFIHWFWAAVLTWLFPIIASFPNGGSYAFGFFAIAMIFQLLFVLQMFPETKGKSLEEEINE
ncbi:sugar porter (SP) family MFS transporter [Salegentibacter sp. 24]|uniref:sugar porter family MFS transporter n=1 Tax=Salegentibacter sp. 24 TaxID=2183986 RepID=UPI00105D356E|nr:sugar porter family MFS transporter [Salegentibacter sp. 24]TDN78733.1 sugar porter (SP) family MFS transporter [Salegentibacter sp. 24]